MENDKGWIRLYRKTLDNFQDSYINKIAITYDGSATATGINIYKNASIANGGTATKFGTYTKMNNRTGFNVGYFPTAPYVSNQNNY